MLTAIDATSARLGQCTVAQLFASDPAFAGRKRNRNGDYSRSVQRTDLEREVRALFAAQRRLANAAASAEFEAAFADAAFSQRPLQDSEKMVESCPFERDHKRTAKRSYAFEMFRLLSRLANLTLTAGGPEFRLSAEQIGRVAADFGTQKQISYRRVRKLLDLDPRTRFASVSPEDEARDVIARSGNAAEGTATLRDAVGEGAWRTLLHAPETLDRIAEILTFRDDPASIRAGLDETGAEPLIVEAIMAAMERGAFARFTGAGHISAKAARALIPHLARGLKYSEACTEVGYDHAARQEIQLEDVRNPVARKALGEMLKQVRALVREFRLPDLIHVELARDVGKSAEERDEITSGIEKRNREKDRLRDEFTELLGHEPGSGDDLLRFELWKEQNYRCLYTDEMIPPESIVATDNTVQVDHILPWSRFGDDSFVNKTLCMAHANQAKQGRTPFEWFSAEKPPADWPAFEARVEGCKAIRGRKKRGFYLRRNATEVEERFRARNLGDTRYATRLLLDLLARLYPKDDQRHVLARPGALTAKLRRAWGLEDIKKDESGQRRADDRHHALDAIVIAATSESMLQALTRASQEAERQGRPRGFLFTDVPEPWRGFREATRAVVANVFVSRAERRRARGEAHAATIRQVREIDGQSIVYERKPVEKLTLADLEKIPVPVPYGKAVAPEMLRNAMVEDLRRWIEAGKPKDAPPLSPKGDVIRKVRVASKDKMAISVRGGTADRGDMARVDVFTQADKHGRQRFFLVPVYPHQVATCPQPPDRAVVAYKPEPEGWTLMEGGHKFLFSLYGNTLVRVVTPDGEEISGYFRGVDRSTGAIGLSAPESTRTLRRGIGAKTLLSFEKLTIDRLGRISAVPREIRTWHGVACT
jgi:CRISPR-associated endonuclease Csn1